MSRRRTKQKAMKKRYNIFDIPPSEIKGWSGGAFCYAFVYTKHRGNFVLRGFIREVEDYLKKYYTHYFVNYTLFHRNEHRNIWNFWKRGVLICGPNKRRRKYRITNFTENSSQDIYFKRLPNRWVPEFDNF
jgi:hypothetical protein